MVRTGRLVTRSRTSSARLLSFLRQHVEGLAVSMLSLGFFGLLMLLASSVSRGATEPTAMLSWDSHQAFISGPIACMPGESFDLQVTLTQGSSSTEGSGSLSAPCQGGVQRWTVKVMALAGASFAPGPARACTVGTLYQANSVMDTRQWCRDIALLGHEGSE